MPPLISSLILLLAFKLAHGKPTDSSIISWGPCPLSASINNATDQGIPLTCGSLKVPRDYTDLESNRTINLQLTRASAIHQPSRGTILVNPGGPGSAGADVFVLGPAEALLQLTGGLYDLVTFNPRGTGQTLPFSCYTSAQDRMAAQLFIPSTIGGSNTALGQVWAANGAFAQLCYENAHKVGSLIGTAFTARDMFQIVDALGEDGLLRFWGFSYGTVLGATAAALFPNRIDRMILDGNLDLQEYYKGTANSLLDDDTVLSGFFTGCLDSPNLCPLAASNLTASELENKTYAFLEALQNDPIPAPQALPTSITINYGNFQNFLHSIIYWPFRWPVAAQALDDLFRGNISGYLLNAGPATTTPGSSLADPDTQFPEAQEGIQCSDSTFRTSDLGKLKPLIRKIKAQSRFFGTLGPTDPTLLCPLWKMQAKEIYSGGFKNISTKHPILFIGNSFDPITPIVNARESSLGFPGSVVLENNGYGHTSIAAPSLCTAKHVLDYFVNGSLPPPNTVCKHTYELFKTPESYLGVPGVRKLVGNISEMLSENS